MEIITIGKAIVETGSTAVLIGLLVVLAVPALRKKIFNSETIHEKLDIIQSNDLGHIDNKLDRLMEAEKEGNLISKEILFVLKNRK